MGYKIKRKNLPPTLTLCLSYEYDYKTLGESTEVMRSIAANNSNGQLICLLKELEFEVSRAKFQVCFPVEEADLMQFDQENFHVLPRVDVVSTIHKGEYKDLKGAFEKIYEYINDKGLTAQLPVRVLHRRGQGLFLKTGQYLTEIQVPVEEK